MNNDAATTTDFNADDCSSANALSETVWLLKSKVNPFPVAAQLTLRDGRLSLALQPGASDAFIGWVAERMERTADDLKAELLDGQIVPVFSTHDFTVTWPKTFAGAAMEINVAGRSWLACLSYPSGSALWQTMNLITGRRQSRAWKAAFAEPVTAA
jgi:hypothetical protein